jgi:hypothetical protein
MTGRHDWPEEARIAAIKVIDGCAGPHLQITVPMAMHLATGILDVVAPLIRAAEREQITAGIITRDDLERGDPPAGRNHR